MYQLNLPPIRRTRRSKWRLRWMIGLILAAVLVAVAWTGRTYIQRKNGAKPTVAARDAGDGSQPATPAGSPPAASAGEPQLALLPTLKDRRYDAAIRDVVVREDPVVDGWETERFNEMAMRQLNAVGELLFRPETIETQQTDVLCAPNYRGALLRPAGLNIVYKGPSLVVRRPTSAPHESKVRSTFAGREGFGQALRQLADPFQGATGGHFKFKIIQVDFNSATKATTTAYFQISGQLPHGRLQVSATWDCAWLLGDAAEAPQLTSIAVADYEEVESRRQSVPLFADCTESTFAGMPVLRNQLVHGRDHWYGNLEVSVGVEGRGNGIAIGDADGDGLDDIYLCQPAALPNRLFLRNRDGSLRDVSRDAGVDWLDSSRAALFVDIDNDGDQDLLLTQSTHIVLHENDGNGSFVVRSKIASANRLFSMNAVDFDNDRDLDLFVCGYSSASQTRPEDIFASPVPYHDANNGGPNVLLRNDGNWRFSDVTRDVGLDVKNLRFSLASAWDDFDNDGDMDLYVANDFGRNNLYRNDNGRFMDIAADAGVEDIGPGMSAAWGDYNNDGLMDIYVSNMFSSAGSRITHNPQFKPDANAADLSGFRRHARGNSLFENAGGGMFIDQGPASGTTIGRWAWGSLFVDINNDGWRDLYVTNGFVTADNDTDL